MALRLLRGVFNLCYFFGRCLWPALYAAIPHSTLVEAPHSGIYAAIAIAAFWDEHIPRISFTRRSLSVGGRCDRYRGLQNHVILNLFQDPIIQVIKR